MRKERTPIRFLQKRKVFFLISILMILSAPVAMLAFKGTSGEALKYSLEFKGGTATNVSFAEDMSIKEIDAKITPMVEKITGDKNVQATKVVGTNQVIIKTVTLDVKEREALNQALEKEFGVTQNEMCIRDSL